MIRGSETQYARAPDGAYLAYQVIGTGDLDIVFHPGAATHAELIWDFPMLMRRSGLNAVDRHFVSLAQRPIERQR